MSNPWDAPPFPKFGNKSARVLFAAIGEALITWEELEITLAHLYSTLKTGSQFDPVAFKEYGEPYNFKDRMAFLKREADHRFVREPDQLFEGEFNWIVTNANGFSQRRNDVAHGVVRLLHKMQDAEASLLSFWGDPQWCLVPPMFKDAKYVSLDTPGHILSYREIKRFTANFLKIIRRTSDLARALEPQERASRRTFVERHSLHQDAQDRQCNRVKRARL